MKSTKPTKPTKTTKITKPKIIKKENEQLIKFTSDVAIPLLKETAIKAANDFYENKHNLRENFLNDIKRIFTATKDFSAQLNDEISYISFALLRTNLLYSKLKYDVHIYDEHCFLRDYIKIGDIDTSIFFQPLEDAKTFLQAERRKWVGKVNASHVDNLISGYLEAFGYLFVKMFRYVLLEATECSEYNEIPKADNFRIITGELWGKANVLHTEAKDRISVKKLHELVSNSHFCQYLDVRNGNYSNMDMTYADLRWSDFRGSSLESVDFSNAALDGCVFAGCNLAASNLSGAQLSECNFLNADLRWANLSDAVSIEGIYENEDWNSLCMIPLNLNEADMREAVIEYAALHGVDFTRTKLEGAIFTGADLTGCKLKEEQLLQINLSDKQMSQVKII